MADILKFPGAGPDAGVTPPFLQNTIYPSGEGFGGQVSLGMGRMTRRFSDVNLPGDDGASEAQLQALYMALSQAQNSPTQNLSVDLRGLQGPPGIPGRTVINYGNPGGGGSPGDSGKTVVLSATQQVFTYDGDGAINGGQTITFTANTDNCAGDYTWAITSPIGGTVRAFTSGGGTSDSTATLSGADFDGWGEDNAEITVTRNGITDTMDIYKVADGTDAVSVNLASTAYTFTYDQAGLINAGQTITFTANTQNGSGNYTWAVTSPSGGTSRAFTSGGGVGDSTATISGADFDGWGQTTARISVTRNGVTDTVEVVKIQDGTNIATGILTNENHTFPSDYFGNVDAGDYAAGICDIIAYIGTTQLTYAASGASTYSLGTLVHSPSSKITISESTVGSQRRLTPSAFDASTDLVVITVPIHVRDAAGTESIIEKVLTYGKSKDGYDSIIAFLTNENHSFPATNAGVVDAGDYAAGICDIQAYIGSSQIQYHASDPSTYSLGTLVHSPASKITISESTVSNQRRLTPSAFDASTDLVAITVPINVRDANSNVTTFNRVLTYGKNKTGAAGVDAFDDIDIPIPYDGWEGAFTDDDPGAGSVSWTSFKVKYKGTEYTVTASNTANAFLYWDASSPTAISSTATRSNVVGVGKFLIGWNNSGTFYPSQFEKLITAGFIDVADLAALGITVVNADIGALAVDTAQIANGAVENAKIGNLAVDTAQIADGAIETAKIGNLAVDTAQIAAGAIETAKIGSLQVTTATIANLNVTSGKLGALAAQTAKIDDDATKIVNSGTGTVSHTTGGGIVEVMGVGYYTAGVGGATVDFHLTYNGGTVGALERYVIPSGTLKTWVMSGTGTGSGSTALTRTLISGSSGSNGISYTRTWEDKFK